MAEKLVFESPRVVVSGGSASARARPEPAPRDPMPVIVGCPRSGTSLLAVMLDSHSQIAVPPETAFLTPMQRFSDAMVDSRRDFFSLVTQNSFGTSNWDDFGLDQDAFWRRLEGIEPFSVAAGVRAFYSLYAEGENKPRWGEKTPSYALCMPFIERLLPEAHFIHIVRDPRDTVLSWRKTWFAPSTELGALTRAWVQHVAAARTAARSARRYLEIRYEELVVVPEVQLRRLCEFLALDYESSMLDYASRGAARLARLKTRVLPRRNSVVPQELRARMHDNLTKPLRADRVQNWRREMTGDERKEVEAAAGQWLAELGYAG